VIVTEILRVTLVLVGFAHLVACLWYGVGEGGNRDEGGSEAENCLTWVKAYGLHERTLGYRYALALHWSVSQYTGGMDEIVPQNLEERTFAITAFLVAFMLASIFVSSLTSSMTRLVLISSRDSQFISVLRKYLAQNNIPERLAMRLQRSAQQAIQEQQRFMPEDEVAILKLVSEPLLVDLHFAMYAGVLRSHPFFAHYVEECPQVMRKVCHAAMSMLRVARGDVLFGPGESPSRPRMYMISSGSLQYVSMSANVHVVQAQDCVSEAALWTRWTHQGLLTANSECRICVLDSRRFRELAKQFQHCDFDPRDYAAAFVRSLNHRAHEAELTDLPWQVGYDFALQKSKSRQWLASNCNTRQTVIQRADA